MGKLTVFNFISLDGYFKDEKNDVSWHHKFAGQEEKDYSDRSLATGDILLFGRITYEMMAGFWPTENAREMFPKTAEGMNKAEKFVFSKSLKKAEWENTKIINENIIDEVKKLKEYPGKDMTILGSGSITSQLADTGLIDVFKIMVDPVILGEGTPIFSGVKKRPELKLRSSRVFKSGIVLHIYGKE